MDVLDDLAWLAVGPDLVVGEVKGSIKEVGYLGVALCLIFPTRSPP